MAVPMGLCRSLAIGCLVLISAVVGVSEVAEVTVLEEFLDGGGGGAESDPSPAVKQLDSGQVDAEVALHLGIRSTERNPLLASEIEHQETAVEVTDPIKAAEMRSMQSALQAAQKTASAHPVASSDSVHVAQAKAASAKPKATATTPSQGDTASAAHVHEDKSKQHLKRALAQTAKDISQAESEAELIEHRAVHLFTDSRWYSGRQDTDSELQHVDHIAKELMKERAAVTTLQKEEQNLASDATSLRNTDAALDEGIELGEGRDSDYVRRGPPVPMAVSPMGEQLSNTLSKIKGAKKLLKKLNAKEPHVSHKPAKARSSSNAEQDKSLASVQGYAERLESSEGAEATKANIVLNVIDHAASKLNQWIDSLDHPEAEELLGEGMASTKDAVDSEVQHIASGGLASIRQVQAAATEAIEEARAAAKAKQSIEESQDAPTVTSQVDAGHQAAATTSQAEVDSKVQQLSAEGLESIQKVQRAATEAIKAVRATAAANGAAAEQPAPTSTKSAAEPAAATADSENEKVAENTAKQQNTQTGAAEPKEVAPAETKAASVFEKLGRAVGSDMKKLERFAKGAAGELQHFEHHEPTVV